MWRSSLLITVGEEGQTFRITGFSLSLCGRIFMTTETEDRS
uniref:Uncharacterized protein n=1 Tax=Anguilla anguilla TaxID=7936 RepID=A0A0E9V3D6_ANGAN